MNYVILAARLENGPVAIVRECRRLFAGGLILLRDAVLLGLVDEALVQIVFEQSHVGTGFHALKTFVELPHL